MDHFQYNPEEDGLFTPVAASSLTPFSPFRSAEPKSLPAWDQVAQRDYLSVALIFPFDGDRQAVEVHLRTSLDRLGRQYEHLAARLKLDPHTGRVSVEKHSADEIPLEVVDHGDKFPYTYDQLKEKAFSPSAFVHPDFIADGELRPFRLVPVSQVCLSFIDGGLILWVYLHHTFADADGLKTYLECLAAATRGEKDGHPENVKRDPIWKIGEDSPSSSPFSSFEAPLPQRPEHAAALSFTRPRPRPDVDGNRPQHLVFDDTWRSLGMDTAWVIPGAAGGGGAVGPAVVRAARGGTALGYAHVLPGRAGGEVVEMVLYIPEAATEALMKDENYMRWVDHVVE